MATAGLTVILGAVYMLNMVQKVFYGPANALTGKALDMRFYEKWLLAFIVLIILFFGVYPRTIDQAHRGFSGRTDVKNVQ